ncbi:hypothetical protein [Comamonas thiooxydans]|uniref:hypothetical protein n=1 Tax=Comamonas thiooxydans TaxID=363952 RepID=UPI0012FF0D57
MSRFFGDQATKVSNHARAVCSKGCESLVLICEISASTASPRKLGVAGGYMGVGMDEIVTGLIATAFAGTDSNAGLLPHAHAFVRLKIRSSRRWFTARLNSGVLISTQN